MDLLQNYFNVLEGYQQIYVAFSMFFSLLVTFIIKLIYDQKYFFAQGSSNIGTAILLIGPAVTGLMISIQSSLPLSLGLLGALSFVRFRNPVKDPEEIAYLLVVIATSVAIAVKAYSLTGMIVLISYMSASYLKKKRGIVYASKMIVISSNSVPIADINFFIKTEYELSFTSMSNNSIAFELTPKIEAMKVIEQLKKLFGDDLDYKVF